VSDPTLFGRAAERLVSDTGTTGMLQTQAPVKKPLESVELELKTCNQVLGVDLRFWTSPPKLGFETQKSVDI
jgi:hypothetical protein